MPGAGLEDTQTARQLYLPVHAMAHAQTVTSSPGPLLRAAAEVLRVAAELNDPDQESTDRKSADQDYSIRHLVAELGRVYERDQEFIRVAADVAETHRNTGSDGAESADSGRAPGAP